jgi:hypothetical protein
MYRFRYMQIHTSTDPARMPPTPVIVLMGDLVASEAARSIPTLYTAFNEVVDQTNRTHRRHLVSPLTITLGDEFQGFLTSLPVGLMLMRDLRLTLLERGVPCRFVLGTATLETPLNRKRAWNMMGQGLGRARDRLNDKRHPSVYRFSLPETPVVESLAAALGWAITDIESGWTNRQFEIVRRSLGQPGSDLDLAADLQLSPRGLYKTRASAKYDLYKGLWRALSGAFDAADEQAGAA